VIDFFDLAKTIGSASGILAAAFLLWDRYVKHFPVAIIVPQPLVPYSQQITHFLFIKNVSDRPILVAWEHGDSTQLRVAKDHSTHAIVRSVLRGETIISLGPETDVFLPIIKPSNYDEIDPDNSLEIHLRWWFAQPRTWAAARKIRVWVRKRDLDHMVDGFVPPTDNSATD
jgi:hypothetical protein